MKNKLKVSKTKIKKLFKNHIKLIIGFLIGISITGGVYAAIRISSDEVYYDNTTSGLASGDVQGAIDELKSKVNTCSITRNSLQVGDYFTLVPDKSTYTIAATPYVEYSGTDTGNLQNTWVKDWYYCCQSTKPTPNSSTGTYVINGTWTAGSAIKDKYCAHNLVGSDKSGSCSGETEEDLYKPSANATTTVHNISSTRYIAYGASTGYRSNQTITPNELTLWRVIDIHSDDTVDAVSEYASSTGVYFLGIRGYANFVETLQTIAEQYAKSGYTLSTRIMGYDGQTSVLSNISAFDISATTPPSTTSTPSPTDGIGKNYTKNSAGDLGDTLYLKDYQLVSNLYQQDNNETNYCITGLCTYKVGTTNKVEYWLASRRYGYQSSTTFTFYGRSLSTNTGTMYNKYLRTYSNSGWGDGSNVSALRPIITLKAGINISGGSGTKASPYTLTNS